MKEISHRAVASPDRSSSLFSALPKLFTKMKVTQLPYKYDISAGICTVCMIVAGNFLNNGHNIYLKGLGIALFLAAIFFWVAPLFALKKYGKTKKGDSYFATEAVVTTGVYALCRHPQYLSYILLVLGFAAVFQNWITYMLAVLAVGLFNFHSAEEEKEMMMKYPRDYTAYCSTVPRFNILLTLPIQIKNRCRDSNSSD